MRRFLRLFALMCFANPLAAAPLSQDDFRTLVQSGDFATVQSHIAELDSAVADGDAADNDDLRHLFTVFQTTHPDVVSTLEHWGEAQPSSLYQKVALGWHYSHLGWISRGQKLARDTHPGAFTEQQHYLNKVLDLALPQFELRQNFIPLNDLVAVTLKHAPGTARVANIADRAMMQNPDIGLLRRLRNAVSPKWGGSWDEVTRMCHAWSDKLPTTTGYSPEICFAESLAQTSAATNPALRIAIDDLLSRTPPPLLDDLRRAAWANDRSRQKDWIAAHIRGFDIHDRYAAYNAHYFANTMHEPVLLARLGDIEVAKQARIRNDPLNPDLVDLRVAKIKANSSDPLSQQTRSESRDQLLKTLHYARFRPNAWMQMAHYIRDLHTPDDLRGTKTVIGIQPQEIAYWEKAVIAGNYDIDTLAAYFTELAQPLAATYLSEMGTAPVLAIAPERAEASLTPTQRVQLAKYAEQRAFLLCPFIKTRFLLQQACDIARRDQFRTCETAFIPFADEDYYPNKQMRETATCEGFERWKSQTPYFERDLNAAVTLPVVLPAAASADDN